MREEKFGYLNIDDWEASMKASCFRDSVVVGVDWRRSGLCAHRLVQIGSSFRTVPLLAEGEYIHRRGNCPPEQFFCGKIKDCLDWIPESDLPGESEEEPGGDKNFLFLVSVPEARLERRQALRFAAGLKNVAESMLGRGKVILFPRVRVVWEHCRHSGTAGGVIQILEEETQFLFRPGHEITVAFGSWLAEPEEDGGQRRYFNRPIHYRENNYLGEADRFLWQDVSYTSWYHGFYQICKKVFKAEGMTEEKNSPVFSGDGDCLPCVEKVLADMGILNRTKQDRTGEGRLLGGALETSDGKTGLSRADGVPAYLLEWFCRVHGLECEAGGSVWESSPQADRFTENIWDI